MDPAVGPRVLRSKRIFPNTASTTGPITKSLSIADATCARFSICGAIWFYELDPAVHDTDALAQHLEQSLRQILDDYRHFAGQLRWSTPADADILPGTQTLGRPLITYNAPTDPGMEFTQATDPRMLNSVLPGKDRTGENKIWRATNFMQDGFLPACPLAFHPDMSDFHDLPGVSAQLTVFACGGWALGMRMTHCLGDAVCLTAFTSAWAARARSFVRQEQVGISGSGEDTAVKEAPVAATVEFDPTLLDRQAGCVSNSKPDEARIARARALPMHRYDCWDADALGMPAWARNDALATRPDARTLAAATATLSPATPPPWHTWDTDEVVEHVQIRVTSDAVRRLRDVAAQPATGGLPSKSGAGEVFVSRLDALIAHLWIAINRARGLQNDEGEGQGEEVYLAVTLGLRGRVVPPLPDTFAGSPLLLGYLRRTGKEVCASSVREVALALRKMMALFTPEAVGAYLHDAAHEISPQRLWQAFLGSRQTGVTSWTRVRVYEVDFGAGKPRWVQARMPRLAGQMQILDVGETGDYEVNLCLEKEAMERLLETWAL